MIGLVLVGLELVGLVLVCWFCIGWFGVGWFGIGWFGGMIWYKVELYAFKWSGGSNCDCLSESVTLQILEMLTHLKITERNTSLTALY